MPIPQSPFWTKPDNDFLHEHNIGPLDDEDALEAQRRTAQAAAILAHWEQGRAKSLKFMRTLLCLLALCIAGYVAIYLWVSQ
jgi:hypothetical protein